jgi:prepilin-type N-terminal cleavage/methylation domain-containing protein
VKRGQRGFTLIELMVALVISTLLVGMILAIFSRMSLAYRGQQQISQVQQVLAAARATLELDAKQAGLGMSQGFSIAPDGLCPSPPNPCKWHSPVSVINSSTGPDELIFAYADPNTQAMVTGGTWTSVTVDNIGTFAQNDIVVVSTNTGTFPNPLNPGVDADIAKFDACVLQITGNPSGNTINFSTAAPYGTAGNAHCNFTLPNPTANKSMIYKVVLHAYRIDPDPTRAADGVFQISASGDLFGLADWQDLAFGFTDIQTAIQFFDNDGIDTPDPDTDPARDWYSSDDGVVGIQQFTVARLKTLDFVPPIEISMSLTARTDKDVEGIATAATPQLNVTGNSMNNTIGDHDSVTLPSGTDAHLQGQRIYRYSTFQVDLRNMGVGR